MKTQIPTPFLTMPNELRKFSLQEVKSRSPYNGYDSGSFYSKEGKTWDYTPNDCIRISDHWNFYSQGKVHCKTDLPNDKIIGKWCVAQWCEELSLWKIISADEKDYSELRKKEIRQNQKPYTDELIKLANERLKKVYEIKQIKEAYRRNKKIQRGTLWCQFETNVWAKGYKGHWNFKGREIIQGQLMRESGCEVVVKTLSGSVRCFRKQNNYTEFQTKPKHFKIKK